MQGNQQVQKRFCGDLKLGRVQTYNQGTPQETVSHGCSMQIVFLNAKYLADQLKMIDHENDLWRKMLFQVPFDWIKHNPQQFQSELVKYRDQLDNGRVDKINSADLRWLKTYVKIMIDITEQQIMLDA